MTIVIHHAVKKTPPDALASVTSVHQEKWEITCTSCDSLHNRHKLHNLYLCAQGTTYCVLQKHKLCLCNKYIYILFPTCVTFFGGRQSEQLITFEKKGKQLEEPKFPLVIKYHFLFEVHSSTFVESKLLVSCFWNLLI